MDLHHAVTGPHEAVHTALEAVMVHHREAAMGLEEASVEVLHRLDGMAGDVADMVPLERDPDLVDRLHQDMEPTLTTDLKVEWHLLTDNGRHPCKTSSWLGALRPAMTLLSARPSRWTSAPEAHQAPYLNRLPLTG
jgi:hypothetical protein